MKKFLATLLTVTMLGSVSVPALAAEQPADTSGSANTTYPADEDNPPMTRDTTTATSSAMKKAKPSASRTSPTAPSPTPPTTTTAKPATPMRTA